MDIEAVKMFSLLAKKLNYTETAKAMDVSQPTLSRKIKTLEETLGVTLIHRRGASISLTPQGKAFLLSAYKIVDLIDQSVEQLHEEKRGVAGQIKIGCLHPMARFLSQKFLADFHDKYPHVDIHFQTLTPELMTRFEDVDLMISPFWPEDDTVVSKKVSGFTRYCYASPDYLKKHGTPKFVRDLELHQCITQTFIPGLEKYWSLENHEGDSVEVEVSGSMTSNSLDIAINLAESGFGIGFFPNNQMAKQVKDGSLIQLFDGEWFQKGNLYIMYKQSTHTPERFKLFIREFQKFHEAWIEKTLNM